MKPLICSTIVILGTASMASAAILIQENFSYTAGALNGQAATGTGLSGTWTKGNNTASTYTVQASSLSFAGHFASSGGSLAITGVNPFSLSTIGTTASATITGGTFYTSSLMTMNTAGTYFSDWALEQTFNKISATDTSGSGYGGMVGRNIGSAFGSGTGSARKVGVGADNSEVLESGTSANAGTTYLFVTTYTTSGANMTATLSLFNETAYASYLSTYAANPLTTNLTDFDLVTVSDTATVATGDFKFLQYAVRGGPTGQMDDFRLGSELTDVVNVVPEPGAALLGGLGMLALLRRRRN